MTARLGVLVKTFPKISETFVLSEILGLERAGLPLTIFSLQRPTDHIAQPAAALLRAAVVYLEPGSDDDCTRMLAKHLCTRGVRHLHAHFVDRPGAIAARAARLAGISFSLSAHARDIYLSEPRALAQRLSQAAFTVTCTDYNRVALQRIALPEAALHCVYHGIDARRFTPAPPSAAVRAGHGDARPLILAIGRLRPKKGFATLIRACALLRDRGLRAHCEIVGYGEESIHLHELVEQLDLGGRVAFAGKMSHADLIERYRAATVFAAPCEVAADGDRDGIPNVLLEAMAVQLPVVTTPVSGIPEVICDGENGLLVAPAEEFALADALEKLIRDPLLCARLGAAARRTVVTDFGQERGLTALIALLRPLLARPSWPHITEPVAHASA